MDRRLYIGSGDAIDLMAGRWHPVWLKKTGRAEDEDLSGIFKVQLGRFTEGFHIEWLRSQLDAAGTVPRDAGMVREPGYAMEVHPFIACHPDAVIWPATPHAVPVEVKHTGGRKGLMELIDFYMPQLQHHLLVTGVPKLIFSAIMGNDEPVHAWIGASLEWQGAMLETYLAFWRLVETDTDPGASAPGVEGQERPSTDPVPINGRIAADLSASNTAAAFTADYLDNEEAAKAHETAKRELKKLVSGEHREVRVGALVMRRDARGAIRFSRCEPDALHPGQPAAA